MKAIVTGSTHIRGQYLVHHLHNQNWQVLAWDRNIVSIFDEKEIYQFLSRTRVDTVFHLANEKYNQGIKNESWLVNYEWPRLLAKVCFKLNIKLVYLSSSDVFSSTITGPYRKQDKATARSGIGYEKRMAEYSLLSECPTCQIYRVGWLIIEGEKKSHLISDIIKQSTSDEKILLNKHYYPACSFINQTYLTITNHLNLNGGIYHLDSNRMWSQYAIVKALNKRYNLKLKITQFEGSKLDERLLEPQINMPPLSRNLAF